MSGQSREIYTYTAPFALFASAWTVRRQQARRVAVGSFIADYSNKVRLLQLVDQPTSADNGAFSVCGEFEHPYPATAVRFVPDPDGVHPDLLATAGDYLRVWRVDDDSQQVELHAKLDNNQTSEFCAPLTAFDWNETQPSIIGTASIDTTCTIWDLNTQTATTQLIAHDKEVYDIAFARGTDVFGSVGADGSLRLFDLRSLEHSTILYECAQPLLRLAWNKQDPNYLLTFAIDSSACVVIDVRVPSVPCAELRGHGGAINSAQWAPHSSCHLATAGEDARVLIWDLTSLPQPVGAPMLAYNSAAGPINNLQWNSTKNDWMSIVCGGGSQAHRLQMLRI